MGTITKISGNRLTYSAELTETQLKYWNYDSTIITDRELQPFIFYIPIQSNAGVISIGLGSYAEG
jgi:hypothetical protein